MYKGVSASPMHGSFAPGYDPGPSDLENLIAGRQRKIPDLMNQPVRESLLSGNVDIPETSGVQNLVGNVGPLAQDRFNALFVALSGSECGLE